jgi:hypothetical protein
MFARFRAAKKDKSEKTTEATRRALRPCSKLTTDVGRMRKMAWFEKFYGKILTSDNYLMLPYKTLYQ